MLGSIKMQRFVFEIQQVPRFLRTRWTNKSKPSVFVKRQHQKERSIFDQHPTKVYISSESSFCQCFVCLGRIEINELFRCVTRRTSLIANFLSLLSPPKLALDLHHESLVNQGLVGSRVTSAYHRTQGNKHSWSESTAAP